MIATTLEQSRKLLELGINPDTADMHYAFNTIGGAAFREMIDKSATLLPGKENNRFPYEPAWSLSALLGLMPRGTRMLKSATDESYHFDCKNKWFDNPVDAAFEMVIFLKENKYILNYD